MSEILVRKVGNMSIHVARLVKTTSVLALAGGTSIAEITVSGDGKFGIDYDTSMDDTGESKHSFKHEIGIDFTASGMTDDGLSFGGKAGFDSAAAKVKIGAAHISGSFGTLTIGDNDPADFLAGGIADVGLNGLGIEEVAETIRGETASELRYDHSFGDITIALSGGTAVGDANAAVKGTNEYAAGMRFIAGETTFGLGYDSNKVISLGLGYSSGQIAATAFYSRGESISRRTTVGFLTGVETDVTYSGKASAMGVDLSYTIGSSTLTIVYAKHEIGPADFSADLTPDDTVNPTEFRLAEFSGKAYGVGIEHDLGGGASMVAGFGAVPGGIDDVVVGEPAQIDSSIPVSLIFDEDSNKASVGLKFTF